MQTYYAVHTSVYYFCNDFILYHFYLPEAGVHKALPLKHAQITDFFKAYTCKSYRVIARKFHGNDMYITRTVYDMSIPVYECD